MELKRAVKKEYFWIFIALTATYFISLPRLKFMIYQNLQLLLTVFITALVILITLYLTKSIICKVVNLIKSIICKVVNLIKSIICKVVNLIKSIICKVVNKLNEPLRNLYRRAKSLCFSSAKLAIKHSIKAWENLKVLLKKLAIGIKETFNLKESLPRKKVFIGSLKTTQQIFKKENFKYKLIGVASFNLFLVLYLIKGIKAETNSINLPGFLEIKFVTYKAFPLVSQKLALAPMVILEYLRLSLEYATLQNVLLAASTTSIAYVLSKKKFRDRIRSILLKSYRITEEKFSEKSETLKKRTKDIVDKEAWQQIRKEAKLFGKELRDELSSKETKKRILLIAFISIATIILISGSLDTEKNMWTSFVAASAGGLCDNTLDVIKGTYRRCSAQETCCNGTVCSTAAQSNYYCYNASAIDDGDASTNKYDYDMNESACINAAGGSVTSWWCNGASSGTACSTGLYGTKTNFGTTWTWGVATTMGYETNTRGQCCGDDAYGGNQEYNLSCSASAGIANDFNCGAGDIACCAGSAHCVDPDVIGLIGLGITTYCYDTKVAYNVRGSTSNESFAYCGLDKKWYDCDQDSATCRGDGSATSPSGNCSGVSDWPRQGNDGGGNSWVIGGESAPFGEYATGTSTSCCGDDPGEYYRSRVCNTGCSTDSSDNACCDASDCVYSNTCYFSGACFENAKDYYCSSGSFEDPDQGETYCIGCNDAWYSGVTGGNNGPCCGDDGADDNFYYYDDAGDKCDLCIEGGDSHETCYDSGTVTEEGTNNARCYYSEGCSLSGANDGCKNGELVTAVITCNDYTDWGDGQGSCLDDTNDVCYYNSVDLCVADDDGWDYDEEECPDYCYDDDDGGPCAVPIRTDPTYAATCYFTDTCLYIGCEMASSDPIRADYCDFCHAFGVTEGDYCPETNASCASGCANSGTIWYEAVIDRSDDCDETTCQLLTDELTIGDVWSGTAAATCDNTECDNDCKYLDNMAGSCVGGPGGVCTCVKGPDCSSGCLYVLNSTGNNVTIFDQSGNIYLAGSLTENNAGGEDGSDLLFKDSSGTTKAWIDNIKGALKLAGKRIIGDCSGAPANTFRVTDVSGNIVSFISDNGTLCVEGFVYQNTAI